MRVFRCRRLLALLLGVAACWPVRAAAELQPPIADARGGPDIVTPFVREQPVVVSITTTRAAPTRGLGLQPEAYSMPAQPEGTPRDPWPRPRRAEPERGLGSGLIVSSDGEILTNAHVVADVDQALVRLADGRQFIGQVVGLDKATDVALVKIDAHGLPTAAIGDSLGLVAGEWVLAIGAPFGLDNSVTAGVVSAPRRVLPVSAAPLIQSDVAINPGSSGGPLVNLRGEVVGLNSMVFSLTGGYMGVSFSVPIDLAMKIAAELRADGRVTRGQLGAKIQELTPELARSFGLQAASGALVLRVVHASPAERAGLRSGDIVMGTGRSVDSSYAQLQAEVAEARPGQRLVLNLWRRGSLQRVELSVGEAPPDLPVHAAEAPGRRDDRLGLNLGEMTASRLGALGLDAGLAVLEAHGLAAHSGVQADDVIVAVSDRPVRSVAEFDAALLAVPVSRPVALLVMRGRAMAYLAVGQER